MYKYIALSPSVDKELRWCCRGLNSVDAGNAGAGIVRLGVLKKRPRPGSEKKKWPWRQHEPGSRQCQRGCRNMDQGIYEGNERLQHITMVQWRAKGGACRCAWMCPHHIHQIEKGLFVGSQNNKNARLSTKRVPETS